MGLASAGRLVYLRAVRASIAFVVVLAATTCAVSVARASEQTITPLTPGYEQRIERLGGDDGTQQVEAVDESRIQAIGPQDPPSPTVKAASTAGKFTLGVLAAVISVGATVASLMLL